MPKEILCAFSIHCDAVAGWLGSYGGEDSPGDISRGVFAGDIGMPRLVQLFERFGMKQSFFIPGHTIESSATCCANRACDSSHSTPWSTTSSGARRLPLHDRIGAAAPGIADHWHYFGIFDLDHRRLIDLRQCGPR